MPSEFNLVLHLKHNILPRPSHRNTHDPIVEIIIHEVLEIAFYVLELTYSSVNLDDWATNRCIRIFHLAAL